MASLIGELFAWVLSQVDMYAKRAAEDPSACERSTIRS
mgnify:CR=1 FL=1|jgi:hypothetical protein